MEDYNILAADCVVISCCCQCLILKIIIFILLKLPYKIIRKTREYTKKKLRIRYRKQAEKRTESVKARFQDEFLEFSVTNQMEELHGSHVFGSCMEEVESILGDFSQKGEFAFGSFWGRQGLKASSSSTCVAKEGFDISLVQFELVEILDSFRYHIDLANC